MSHPGRLSRCAAQRRVKRALRAVLPVDMGGPGSERVADLYGCAATRVREWAHDEAADRHAPLALLLQLDAETYRALLDELEAARAEVYGPPRAPATRAAAAVVKVGTSGRANAEIATALANDGAIDDREAPGVAVAIRRDIAASTALLGKLGGGT